jgi:hypothetical protein
MKVEIGDLPHNSEPRLQFVQIDKWDTYNLDQTVALIMVPLLKAYKENQLRGCPARYLPVDEEEMEKAMEAWETDLDSMIWSFEHVLTDQYFSTKMAGSGNNYVKFRRGLELFIDNFSDLWW